ncbi:uncharacterized protein LOC129599800 [Paramacrobiotus metropolitanus]|uniref:uncharacterized protein LOC129599800 n=1 Tax=Paramacrobiotus metropolitanus TaxID=2943436 RepID=UPI0024459167|nr:uncharacterized protein LOC129599800 [Paramacrobiotus metropolitanus]
MDRLRIPLPKEKLAKILPWLEKDFPNSLPVYHMARNIVEDRFAYPEMKFIVDKLPVPSVCLCKPMRSKTTRSYDPIFNDHLLVYVHAHSVKAFQKMLRCQPELFFWGKDTTFIVSPKEGFPSGQRVFTFNLDKCKVSRCPLPSDLRLGILSPEHAEQIVQECRYANTTWTKLFRYMLSHGFPSVALYDDNVARDTPIAYCMYLMHGCVGAVYVQPAYCHRDLFGVVIGELLIQLQTRKVPSVWMQTMNLPLDPQLEILRGLGGVQYKRRDALCWTTFRRVANYIDPFPVIPTGTVQQRIKAAKKIRKENKIVGTGGPRLPVVQKISKKDHVLCDDWEEAER